MNNTTPQQQKEYLDQINQLIKLDEYSLRIDLWMLNFDSDMNVFQKNISQIKNLVETQKIEHGNNKQQNTQITQSVTCFYIINKFDARNRYEDNIKEEALKIIKESLNSEDFFMISSQDALNYNVMNYGPLDSDIFVDDKNKIESDSCLIDDQDFGILKSQISREIVNQLNNLFKQQFELLEQDISLLDQEAQTLYFSDIKDKMNVLSEQAKNHKDIGNITLFQKMLEEDITIQMNTIEKYIQNSKIYIVFMGTLSSGKSTFINSLLGQQLLPSKNQSCTSKVTFIGHQNTDANNDTKVTIDGEIFYDLKQAQQKLIKMQQKHTMSAVNIKTQSYFHKQLREDLRDRVFFIDTPGIEISKTTPEQYMLHFGKINQLIESNEYSLRINLWILNYTTFDSDKQTQMNMQFMTKNDAEQVNQQDLHNFKQNNLKINLFNPQIRQSHSFFYILNKYDQYKQSQDDSNESVLNDIMNIFNSDRIFKISAQNALNYNIMNFGTRKAKQYFIEQFFDDNQYIFNLGNLNHTYNHCQHTITHNNKLITRQDFDLFISQISLEIENQLNEILSQKLIHLKQLIALLDLGQNQMNEQEKYFKSIKHKLLELSEQVKLHKDLKSMSKIQKIAEQDIPQKIDALDQYLEKSKIYIVFMGTLSSGKSTFINSLLGQQLLPSNNQSSTSQVTYIGHQNTYANQITIVTINGEEFKNLEQASQKLIQIQQNKKMELVRMKTQSYFHKQLKMDLQDRVFFIDTPGIEMNNTTPQQQKEYLDQINQLIELDEYSLRIDLWMLNFDSDMNVFQKNISQIQNLVETYKIEHGNNKQQNTQITQSVTCFYIINKFDARNRYEDNIKEEALKIIKESLNSEDFFMISSQDALNYNVMNYGPLDSKDKLLHTFLNNNKQKITLMADAKDYCSNPFLIKFQDFNKFTSHISFEIENQKNNAFKLNLEKLKKMIDEIDEQQQFMKEIIDLNRKLKDEVKVKNEAINNNFKSYKNQLKYNDNSIQSIASLISQAILQLEQKEKQAVIEETCQKILGEIDKINKEFIEITLQYKQNQLNELSTFESQLDSDSLKKFELEYQNIFQGVLDDKIPEYIQQFIEKQVKYVYETMGIRSYRTTFESIMRPFKLVFGIFGFKLFKFPNITEGSVQLCAIMAASSYVTDKSIDLNELKNQLEQWNGKLQSEFKELEESFIQSCTKVLLGIKEAMDRITI